jgi:hypothetical protein
MNQEVESLPFPFSLRVQEVDSDYYDKLKLSIPKQNVVKEDHWLENNSKSNVLSEAAAPCAIIYVKAGERIISGHFLKQYKEKFDPQLQSHLKKISQEMQEKYQSHPALARPSFSDLERIEDFENAFTLHQEYNRFLKRVSELIAQSEKDAVEAYLFGQNFDAVLGEIDDVTDVQIDRFHIATDLHTAGIPIAQIADHRTLDYFNRSDNTFYVGTDDTIYVARNKNKASES